MADPAVAQRSAAAAAGSFVGTFAIVLAAIGALFVIDTLLVEKERAERRSEARQLFEEGLRLQRDGNAHDAVDRLRVAFADERENSAYQRALAAAELAAGKVSDAETVLTDRLQRDPVDAAASLIMARALVREHKFTQAISFYHRAIYGRWDDDRMGNRVQARFELVDLLAARSSRQELLAELLPLQSEAPGDVPTRKRIARLFIAAGSPARAIDLFRDILRREGSDADAYAGIGEAEFQRGNYRAARGGFLSAIGLRPQSPEIKARLALCNQVLALDPTQRGIGTTEQYRRSMSVLRVALESAAGCAESASVQPLQVLADTVRTALIRRVPASRLHEAAESNLDLATRFWQARRRDCAGPVADSARAMELVLEKSAQ